MIEALYTSRSMVYKRTLDRRQGNDEGLEYVSRTSKSQPQKAEMF